jgi:hypothetical protein
MNRASVSDSGGIYLRMNEGAFRALTMLVAASEHALSELRTVVPQPEVLIAQIERTREAALGLAEAAAEAEETTRASGLG